MSLRINGTGINASNSHIQTKRYSINRLPENSNKNINISKIDQLQNQNKVSKIMHQIKKESIKYHNFNTSINKNINSLSNRSIINQHDQKNHCINYSSANDFQFQKEFNNNQFFLINKKKNIREKFSEYEDEILKNAVQKHGAKNWRYISSFLPGRSSRQCRDRYANYLAPEIDHSVWKKEEDKLLIEKFLVYGPKWSIINKFFPNRTANSIKNRYNYTLKKRINNFQASLK